MDLVEQSSTIKRILVFSPTESRLPFISITLYLKRKHTFTISALPPPQEANMAHSQLLIIGKVMVTLLGGGFGESLMGEIISLVTCN